MEENENQTIELVDRSTGQSALVLVRRAGDLICLGLSLRGDGDIEVAVDRRECRRIIEALQGALNEPA